MGLGLASPDHLRLRALGATIAAGLSGLVAAVGALDLDALVVMVIGGLVGVPVGALVGWWRAPRIRAAPAARDAFDQVLAAAVMAVPIGAIELAAVLALGGLLGGEPASASMLAAVLPFAIIGLVIFGLPALALAIAVIGVWAIVLRHLPDALVGDGACVVAG